ncbi:helix-turn-helix domain-containing protein [Rubrivirga sp. IMCC45206]|uniref:helix-turn-helix domain-containing protein n=1 Tax=Rubrivirga sp. IMCC45206 TaxID=3391614 RepID=UPI003990166C
MSPLRPRIVAEHPALDACRAVGVDPHAPSGSLTAAELIEALARRLEGPPSPVVPEWLPTREAARYCRVSTKTLQAWANSSDVIEVRRGSGRAPSRYLRSSLDAYLGEKHDIPTLCQAA